MKFYTFEELGYITETACKAIKERLEGKTYMNFKIQWTNCGGNRILIVGADGDESEEEVKNFFYWCVIENLVPRKGILRKGGN